MSQRLRSSWILIGLLLSTRSVYAQEDGSGVARDFRCEEYFIDDVRFTKLDWNNLDRDARLAVLTSQVVSLYAGGFVPTARTLETLTPAEARRIGWTLWDLTRVAERAKHLFPDSQGSGLKHLVMLAGYTLKPKRAIKDGSAEERRRAERAAGREVKAPSLALAPDVLDVSDDDFKRLAVADRVILLGRQVDALVGAGLLRSIYMLADITAEQLASLGSGLSLRGVQNLNVRACELIPAVRLEEFTVNGMSQLMMKAGIGFRETIRPRPEPEKITGARTGGATKRAPDHSAIPRTWTEIRPIEDLRTMGATPERADLLARYRRECRAIMYVLKSMNAAIDFSPAGLARLSATTDWASTRLNAEVVRRLPERAGRGFLFMNGYLGLLKEHHVRLSAEEILKLTGTKRISAEDYVPQERASSAPTVLDRTELPAASPAQEQLTEIFVRMEQAGLATDPAALRGLSHSQQRSVGLSAGIGLEYRVQSLFPGGWREWVTRSGGDPDRIIAAARSRDGAPSGD